MTQKIHAREHYEEKLKEAIQGEIKLCNANLKLLTEKANKVERELEELRSTEAEWLTRKKEAEDKILSPDPIIKRMLERDFHGEVALRMRGGDPGLKDRYGEAEYGVKFKHRNRRKVTIPRLKREGERSWYSNEEIEVEERRTNAEAYQEWETYMTRGLEIKPDWDFDKTFEEIQNFFFNAPDLNRYGTPYEVFVESEQPYQEETKPAM